jgi:CelD/BcsL family acetyltransferase involved in cellulose biosynthesis
MPRPSPFFLHRWLVEWYREFGDGFDLAVQIARRDGQLVGALPLCVSSRFGLRIGTFIGGGESALGDLLLADAAPDATDELLIEHHRGTGIDALDIFGLPRSSRLATALGPRRLSLIERVEAPVLALGRDWEAFSEAKLQSSRRRELRRRARGLEKIGKVEMTLARDPAEVAAVLDDAFRLHALRWNGRPDHSTFGTSAGQRFHRRALVALANDDVVRFTTMKLDGRTVAFQCWFGLSGSAYMYRQSYDPELARFGIGFMTTLEAIKEAMAEGHTRLEFLGGAESYKLELADGFEPMCQGVGLASGARGAVFVAARLAALRGFRHLRRSSALRRLYYDGLAPARRALLTRRSREAS